jgi:NHL repeat-containing protein
VENFIKMATPLRFTSVSNGIIGLALLSACSSGTAAVPASNAALSQHVVQSASVLRPDVAQLHSNVPAKAFFNKISDVKGKESVIVSDASNNVVDIFNAKGVQTAQLTGFSQPQGLAVDRQGNLYVADTNNSRIQVYAAGFGGTPTTIADTGESPAGVAIDSKGDLAVTNIISTSDGAGSVSFFNKSGTLLTTISSPSFAKIIFDAFDRKGNLYIDGTNASGGAVVGEIVGGVNGKSISVLTTGNTIGYPGGIAIASSGTIAIDDQENIAIYTYNAPAKGGLGAPIATTPLTGAGDPISITYTQSDKGMWVADPARGGAPNKVLVPSSEKYQFPAGGDSTKTILFSHGSQPTGIVLSRPAK